MGDAPVPFPTSAAGVIRLAVRRLEPGSEIEDILASIMPAGAWQSMSEDQQGRLFALGIYAILQDALVPYLDAHREAFLADLALTDPIAFRVVAPVMQGPFAADAFRAFLELEITP